LLEPQKAEAMPIGKITKTLTKAAKGAESSAVKALRGKTLQGKIIKDVRKGTGDWRAIVFEDDSQMTIKKQHVNDLCRAFGREKYTSKFALKERDSKTVQALRSLRFHEARVRPLSTRRYTRFMHKEHAARLRQIAKDETLDPDTSFVLYQDKYFTMPKDYAVHLEDLGLLKIMRGKADILELPKVKK
jgi:hypothetical protein